MTVNDPKENATLLVLLYLYYSNINDYVEYRLLFGQLLQLNIKSTYVSASFRRIRAHVQQIVRQRKDMKCDTRRSQGGARLDAHRKPLCLKDQTQTRTPDNPLKPLCI